MSRYDKPRNCLTCMTSFGDDAPKLYPSIFGPASLHQMTMLHHHKCFGRWAAWYVQYGTHYFGEELYLLFSLEMLKFSLSINGLQFCHCGKTSAAKMDKENTNLAVIPSRVWASNDDNDVQRPLISELKLQVVTCDKSIFRLHSSHIIFPISRFFRTCTSVTFENDALALQVFDHPTAAAKLEK